MIWAAISIFLSLVIAALGAFCVFSPATLLQIGWQLATPVGLFVAAAIRFLFGAALALAAPTSRAPRSLRVIGLVIVVAGLMTPLFGVERARAVLGWWSAQGPSFARIWGGFALAVGSSLVYLLLPKSGVA